jgi:hypothetical protein
VSGEPAPPPHNLPPVCPAGFFGRSRELWEIERRLVAGTRRLVIHGFGGQGKTVLAKEAGRWLLRTGLFERVCLVGYAGFQGVDPVGLALAALGPVLGQSLIDAEAARPGPGRHAHPGDPGQPGGSGRPDPLGPGPPGRAAHRRAPLVPGRPQPGPGHHPRPGPGSPGLPHRGGPRLPRPPTREPGGGGCARLAPSPLPAPSGPDAPGPGPGALVGLFGHVACHPLSIAVLARELKTRRPAELGERLTALLAQEENGLRASLALSLERLTPDGYSLPWIS